MVNIPDGATRVRSELPKFLADDLFDEVSINAIIFLDVLLRICSSSTSNPSGASVIFASTISTPSTAVVNVGI